MVALREEGLVCRDKLVDKLVALQHFCKKVLHHWGKRRIVSDPGLLTRSWTAGGGGAGVGPCPPRTAGNGEKVRHGGGGGQHVLVLGLQDADAHAIEAPVLGSAPCNVHIRLCV